MLKSLVAIAQARTVRKTTRHSRYVDAVKNVPMELLPHWKKTAHLEFPGISQSTRFFAHALDGLMMFLECASRSSKQCGLPSRAADSVWHAWISMDKENLDRFCVREFGRCVPHVEARDMQAKLGIALGTCLVACRRLTSMYPAAPELPLLFTLDRLIRMPHGFGYTISAGLVAFCPLDDAGLPRGEPSFPDDLTPYGLFKAGLINEVEYHVGIRLAGAYRGPGGSTPGASCGGFTPHAGAVTADAGGGTNSSTSCNDGNGDSGGSSAGASCGGDGGGGCGGGD